MAIRASRLVLACLHKSSRNQRCSGLGMSHLKIVLGRIGSGDNVVPHLVRLGRHLDGRAA